MQDTTPSFHKACACLLCDHTDLVSALLHDPTHYTPLERTYLRAWMACKAGRLDEQSREWEVAEAELLNSEVVGSAYQERTQGFTIRRKRPWVTWLLGNLAHTLHRHEALDHYAAALILLQERRMDIPWLHALVVLAQGNHMVSNGWHDSAHAYYELALKLCPDAEEMHEALADIHAGLSKTHQQSGNREQAIVSGKQALHFQPDGKKRTSLFYILGDLYTQHGQLAEAISAYQEALWQAQSTHDATMLINCLLGLALASLHPHAIRTARSYCIRALEDQATAIDAGLRGKIFAVCGKVAHFQAGLVERSQAQELWQEAVACYLQALTFRPKDAEILEQVATLLEEILDKDASLASWPFWRQAYHVVTGRA